jgi:twitching motility protein PilT
VADLVEILTAALEKGASDVLLTSGSPPAFRIEGKLFALRAAPLTPEESKKTVYGVLTDPQIARFESQKELDFSFTLKGSVRFRGNVFLQRGSVSAAFRMIPSKIPSLAELNLPPVLSEFALAPQGFVVVTGPTGHGKSTTLAAMIDLVNTQRRCHVVTIEDPIEYVHVNRQSIIEQREVGEDTHSFAAALKHVLRQNPDVILVGEMRDPESIAAALTAAETGHLVISTLHTNDCVQAVDRIIDSFAPHQQSQVRSQLSLALLAVIAQRLIPRTDGRGRIPAVEILRNSAAVANLLREEKTHQLYSVMETHARDGMKTLDASLKDLYLKGMIDFEEARMRMRNPLLLEG